jgi:DNA-3-methyladenine glycosylase II
MTEVTVTFQTARRHLARRDAVLKRVIAQVGACTLWQNPNRFGALARSIIGQQISTKAAASIAARLEEAVGRKGLRPKAILALPDLALRDAGLSAAKSRALRDLAAKVADGSVPLNRIHEHPDEEVIARLIQIWGIGRWTAEMFLIFSLGRLDVLPVDDGGLRAAVQRQYGLPDPPAKGHLTELAEPWRPYRSIATWYLWRSLGFVPQSD